MNTAADPAQLSAIGGAALWIESLLTGGFATAVAVIVVACLGLVLMSGRLPRRRTLELVIGCFIVFGAPAIADGIFRTFHGSDASAPAASQVVRSDQLPAPVQMPVASQPYDPYAGAALPPRR